MPGHNVSLFIAVVKSAAVMTLICIGFIVIMKKIGHTDSDEHDENSYS